MTLNVSNSQCTLRFGGPDITGVAKDFISICEMNGIAPNIILAVACDKVDAMLTGMHEKRLAQEIHQWMDEFLVNDSTIPYTARDEICTTISSACAIVIRNICNVIENGQLNDEGTIYHYALLRLSGTGAIVLGRFGSGR